MRRSTNKITMTITTSPTNTYRHEANVVTAPPIRGPAATAIAPAAATRPYAADRFSGGKFAATNATMAGMISAAPMPSSNDHPINSTGRFGANAVVSDPRP